MYDLDEMKSKEHMDRLASDGIGEADVPLAGRVGMGGIGYDIGFCQHTDTFHVHLVRDKSHQQLNQIEYKSSKLFYHTRHELPPPGSIIPSPRYTTKPGGKSNLTIGNQSELVLCLSIPCFLV